MATFNSTEEAKARYDELAKGLLTGDVGGTRFGHNQVQWDGSKFITNDLQYKKGDPNQLKAHGQSVADTLNKVVNEYGLDTSHLKSGQYLGAVYNNVGGHGTVDAKTAYDRMFSTYFQPQLDARFASYAPKPAEPPPAPPPPAPPPLEYGQPAPAVPQSYDPVQQPAPPQDPSTLPPQGLASLPGVNNLPQGPTIGGYYGQATASGDPFMRYQGVQYRPHLTGQAAYDQMGLQGLSTYAMGADKKEHNFFPNRSTFLASAAPKRYGEGSTDPAEPASTEIGKGVDAIYKWMAG